MQKKHYIALFRSLFIASCLFVLYLFRPWGLFFLNDDLIHIPLSANGILGQHNSVRFFNDLTLYVDSILFGRNATGYHFTNLLIHSLCTVALFAFIKQLQQRKMHPFGNGFAWLSSVLFFCYPFHSESIFWIIGRGSSVSTFFLLISFIFYLKKEQHYIWGLLSFIPFIIALFTYESVWFFPIIFIFIGSYNIQKHKSILRKELAWSGAFMGVFVLFFLCRHHITGEIVGTYEQEAFTQNGWTVLPKNLIRLALRAVTMPLQNSKIFVLTGLVLLITIAFSIIRQYIIKPKQRNWLLAICTCFFFSLFPYLTLGIDTHGTQSERFLYLPSIFICLLIASLIISIRHMATQLLVTAIVFAYFIISLCLSSVAYRTASTIVSNTFLLLHKMPEKKYVLFKNVPKEYKGAVMLQLGLQPGWKWLKENEYPDSLIIESYGESDQLFQQTIIRYKALENDVYLEEYFSKENNIIRQPRVFDKNEAAIIAYDSIGIIVYK